MGWFLVYLMVGYVIVVRHRKCEAGDCSGWDVLVVMFFWPLYLVYRSIDYLGRLIINRLDE